MDAVLIDVNRILARSAELEERLLSFFSLPLVQASNRLKATQALTSLGFEHASSLKYLIAGSMYTSAAVLLRVQYESLVRAIWVLYCGTDAQADQMMAELSEDAARRTSNLPMSVRCW